MHTHTSLIKINCTNFTLFVFVIFFHFNEHQLQFFLNKKSTTNVPGGGRGGERESLDNKLDDLVGMFSKTTSNYKFYIQIYTRSTSLRYSVTLDTICTLCGTQLSPLQCVNNYCKPADQFKASKFNSRVRRCCHIGEGGKKKKQNKKTIKVQYGPVCHSPDLTPL